MLHCYNRGCGQKFDPQENKADSCQYHPGEPYFHDVYKGWSCCKKKSVDFTDFLNFKGCSTGRHSNEKPPEPEKHKDDTMEEEVVVVRAPIAESTLHRPPFETDLLQLDPTLNANFKKQIDELVVPRAVEKSAEESNVIAVGTNCKNRGCTASYQSDESNYFECVYHPGVPVFHEGMKYWSCCQRKTSDFTVFVAQKGCETGLHQWKSSDSCEQTVKCRYDWHQTGNHVVVAIYAKMYDYRISYVQLNPIRLKVHLVFPQQANATFDMDLELRGLIDPKRSTVSMMGTKLEITLCKAELGSWPKLDFPRKVDQKTPEAEMEQLNIDNIKAQEDERVTEDSDSDVDLDDVGPVYTSAKITEVIE